MKYVFYLLLLTNVVFFLWEENFGAARRTRQTTSLQSVGGETPERIVLIEELPVVSKKATAPASTPAENAPVAEVPPVSIQAPEPPLAPAPESGAIPACYRIGPFASENDARERLNGFQSRDRDLDVRIEPLERVENFLVLYPKSETPERLQADKKRLFESGIKDMWVVDKGAMQGSISLGSFKKRERAEVALRDLQKKGINAEIYPRTVPSGQFLLLIRGRDSESAFREFIEKAGLPRELSPQRQVSCG
jgi:hypothetical protein